MQESEGEDDVAQSPGITQQEVNTTAAQGTNGGVDDDGHNVREVEKRLEEERKERERLQKVLMEQQEERQLLAQQERSQLEKVSCAASFCLLCCHVGMLHRKRKNGCRMC